MWLVGLLIIYPTLTWKMSIFLFLWPSVYFLGCSILILDTEATKFDDSSFMFSTSLPSHLYS